MVYQPQHQYRVFWLSHLLSRQSCSPTLPSAQDFHPHDQSDCEYSEYENFEEIKEYYSCSHDFSDIKELSDYTIVLEIEGSESLIIQDF